MLQQEEEGGDDRNHPMKKTKVETMDPFSNLPDPIVHHVMSFLTNSEIVRISTLSKRFFSLWSLYPVIQFDQEMFFQSFYGIKYSNNNNGDFSLGKPFVSAFINHIHNSMSRRGRMDTTISEFRIKADHLRISNDRRLDSVILMALENGVRCMDLNLGFGRYCLPHKFASIWIKVLRLAGVKLDLCNLIKVCPSLGSVSLSSCQILHDVRFSSETLTDIEFRSCKVKFIKLNAPNLHSFFFDSGNFENFETINPCEIDVSKCPNIMYLSLNNVISGRDWIEDLVDTLRKLKTFIFNGCNDIVSFRVWNEKLERLEIGNCPSLDSIELITRSLKSFAYNGIGQNMLCNISFIVSKYIKDLSIENAFITDEWLETQIATLKCLESLRLKTCNLLKNVRLFHKKLRNFELCECLNLVEADIDTPELDSFMYQGDIIELRKIVTKSNCNATLSMSPWITYNNETYSRWRNMLSYFGHWQSLKLICSSQKEVIIPEDLRETLVSPLYDLKHMEIQIISLQKIDRDLVDSLLWLSPIPETLHIFSTSNHSSLQMIIKFTYDEKLGEEEDKDPFCCINKPIKCWKHSLTSVEIHSSDVSPRNGSSELQKYFIAKTKMPVRFVLA